jgi:hypothetical protein
LIGIRGGGGGGDGGSYRLRRLHKKKRPIVAVPFRCICCRGIGDDGRLSNSKTS